MGAAWQEKQKIGNANSEAPEDRVGGPGAAAEAAV